MQRYVTKELQAKELPFITIPLASGEQYAIYTDNIIEWVSAFPGVDAFQELRKNRRWHLADASWLKGQKRGQVFA